MNRATTKEFLLCRERISVCFSLLFVSCLFERRNDRAVCAASLSVIMFAGKKGEGGIGEEAAFGVLTGADVD